MRRFWFRALTLDVEVVADETVLSDAVRALTSTYPPAEQQPSVHYELFAQGRVVRDGEVLGEGLHALDVLPVFEFDLYRQMLLRAEGLWLLHAAAVVHERGAWILVGPSGVGKSTLALALAAAGLAYLSDEYVGIDGSGQVFGARRPVAFARRECSQSLPAEFRRVSYSLREKQGVSEQVLWLPPEGCLQATRSELCGLVLLGRSDGSQSCVSEPIASDALQVLWDSTLNPGEEALSRALALTSQTRPKRLLSGSIASATECLLELFDV